MRVLITNSLVLAAISLAPAVSAAPYAATSSVDSYDSYPNATMLSQDSGPSSAPSVRRDEVIHVQSLYDASPFGRIFGPVADLFGTIGMNTISDSIPLTEAQKTVLDQLHNALDGAAGNVIAQLPANLPLSSLSLRSLEDRELANSLVFLGPAFDPVSDLLSSVGVGSDPTAPLTDLQKQVIARLQTAIGNAVGDVTATVPVKLDALPFGHQSRSVEERSLPDILSAVTQVSVLSSVLKPVLGLINSLDIANGTPLNDGQKLVLSKLQEAIAEAAQNIQSRVAPVHIEHAREEHEHLDHHHDPHRDDRSHDEHKADRKFHDAHKDDHKPQDVHKADHKSPDAHKEDHKVQSANREGDHCREPRDGQRDGGHKWDDCEYHEDGKDRDGDSPLLKINLGHSHHP